MEHAAAASATAHLGFRTGALKPLAKQPNADMMAHAQALFGDPSHSATSAGPAVGLHVSAQPVPAAPMHTGFQTGALKPLAKQPNAEMLARAQAMFGDPQPCTSSAYPAADVQASARPVPAAATQTGFQTGALKPMP